MTTTVNKKRKKTPPTLIDDNDDGNVENKRTKLGESVVPPNNAVDFLDMPVEMCNHVLSYIDMKRLISMLAVSRQLQRLIYHQMSAIDVLNLESIPNATLSALKLISERCTQLKFVYWAKLLHVPTVDGFLEWCRSLAMYKKRELLVEVPLKLIQEKAIDLVTAFEIFRKEPTLTRSAALPTAAFMGQPGGLPPLIPKEFTMQAKKLVNLQIYGHGSIESSHHFICHHPGELNSLDTLSLQHVAFRLPVISSSTRQPFPNPLFNQPPSLSRLLLVCVHGIEQTDFWPLLIRGSRRLKILQLIAIPSVNDDILGAIEAANIETFHIKECLNVTQWGLVNFLNRCYGLKAVKLELTYEWEQDPASYKYLEEYLKPATNLQASTLYRFIAAFYWSKQVNNVPKAIELIDRILVRDPNDDAAWCDKGTLLGHIDKFHEGLVCLDTAIALNDKNIKAWESRIVYLEHTKQYKQAIEYYPRVFDTSDRWVNKTSFLWKQNTDNSLDEIVLRACNMALERFPDNPSLWEIKAHSLLKAGGYKQEALDAYETALRKDPSLPTSQAGRAAALSQLGRLEDAIAAFQVALDNPKLSKTDAATLCFARGTTYSKMKRYEDALDSIDIAIGIVPQKSNYWFKRAETLIHMRRFPEAVASLEKGLELDPSHQRAALIRNRIQAQLASEKNATKKIN